MTILGKMDVINDIQQWEETDLISYIRSYFKYQKLISPTTLKHLRLIVKERKGQ